VIGPPNTATVHDLATDSSCWAGTDQAPPAGGSVWADCHAAFLGPWR